METYGTLGYGRDHFTLPLLLLPRLDYAIQDGYKP